VPARLIALGLCLGLLGVAAVAFALTRDDGDGGERRPTGRAGAIVWAVGDGGDGSATAKAVAARIRADRPDRVLYLGDVYDRGTAEEFRVNFRTVYGDLVKRMEPTPGNHEWPRRAEGYDPFWRAVKGRALPHFYAFNMGGWRIISLNSEDPANPEQLAFLRRELFNAEGACVIPFWHRPRFNAGEHREEEADIQPLWHDIRGKVAFVLSGHDHNLQRFRPVGGTVQYVVGAGGHERYDVDEDDERLAFSEDGEDGALRMQLRPGVARLSFVTADGDELDPRTVRCRRTG
jgi:hypothetical protein